MDTTKFEYFEPGTEKSDSVSGITLDSDVGAWTLNGHYAGSNGDVSTATRWDSISSSRQSGS
jgi:hypothetical protein